MCVITDAVDTSRTPPRCALASPAHSQTCRALCPIPSHSPGGLDWIFRSLHLRRPGGDFVHFVTARASHVWDAALRCTYPSAWLNDPSGAHSGCRNLNKVRKISAGSLQLFIYLTLKTALRCSSAVLCVLLGHLRQQWKRVVRGGTRTWRTYAFRADAFPAAAALACSLA